MESLAQDYEAKRTVYQHRGKQGTAQRTAQRVAAQAVEGGATVEDNYNDVEGQHWLVSSSSEEGATYKVTGNQESDSDWVCICPGFAMRRSNPLLLARTCKHVQAVRLRAQLPPLHEQLRAPMAASQVEEVPPPPVPLASPQTHLRRSMKRMANKLGQLSRDLDEMTRFPVDPEQQVALDAINPALQQISNRIKALRDGTGGFAPGTLPSRRRSNKSFKESMGSATGGFFPKRKTAKRKSSSTRLTTAQREETLTQLSQVEPSLKNICS